MVTVTDNYDPAIRNILLRENMVQIIVHYSSYNFGSQLLLPANNVYLEMEMRQKCLVMENTSLKSALD